MNILEEPKRKPYGVVIGVAIAVLFGLLRGSRMEATSQSDFFALVIAFLIILAACGGIGYFIDHHIHRHRKKSYHKAAQKQYEESYGRSS